MAASVILVNFEWPYLRNGSRSTYSAHRAVIFAMAQLFCFIKDYDDDNDHGPSAGNQ